MIRKLGPAAAYTYRQARRVVVLVIGFTVVLLGVVMIVTPGPGLAAILLGLAILGVEFAWARRWLKHTKEMAGRAFERRPGRARREEARVQAESNDDPQPGRDIQSPPT